MYTFVRPLIWPCSYILSFACQNKKIKNPEQSWIGEAISPGIKGSRPSTIHAGFVDYTFKCIGLWCPHPTL